MTWRKEDDGTMIDDDNNLYVRPERRCGFTDEQIIKINQLRQTTMKYGEHITTEDALSFARAVKFYFDGCNDFPFSI